MEIDAVNIKPSFKALFWTFSDGAIIYEVTYASIPQRANWWILYEKDVEKNSSW